MQKPRGSNEDGTTPVPRATIRRSGSGSPGTNAGSSTDFVVITGSQNYRLGAFGGRVRYVVGSPRRVWASSGLIPAWVLHHRLLPMQPAALPQTGLQLP